VTARNSAPATKPAPGLLYPVPPESAFVAWRRPSGGRWRKVAESDSYADCWSALYEAMGEVTSGSWDNVVLPSGQKP
jgi:hypothetical protein